MNKKITYKLLLLIFLLTTSFVVAKYAFNLKNKDVAFYPLLERKGPAALLPEWASTKSQADKLIRIVRETPGNTKAALQLATLYIQEGRVTGNYTYYNTAAIRYIENVLERQPENFEALILKAIVQLSQHHFADALQTAGKARKVNPYNAFVYGLMVDGNVEMGNYEKAVEASDKMMSIRPDIRSYSRVSYLREIYGDYPGSIEAMKMAVDAGGGGDEPSAWARVQLAKLYENTGDIPSAAMHYTITLEERPGYGYAIAGLGHLALVQGDYAKAILLYRQADSTLNDYALKEQLAELYILTSQKGKAKHLIQQVIDELTKAAQQGDQSISHHTDRELAYVYLLAGENRKALQHALIEYNRRPDNIDVNETVAWCYYKTGDYEKAASYMKVALRTNCQNPTLLAHGGLIYMKSGDLAKGRGLLGKLSGTMNALDPLLKEEVLQQAQKMN
jgi:tetratricopeptide (TPR) repeat protein